MNSDTSQKALKVIVYSQLLAESIDDLKNTSLYKYKTKQRLNNTEQLLKNYIKQYDDVYNANPEIATNILNELDLLIEKLASKNITQIITINQMHDRYLESPEVFNQNFNLKLTKLKT